MPAADITGPLKIVMRKLADLRPADYNPRQLTEKQFADIRASLVRFGFVDPLVVNVHPERANVIIGGHQRWRIAADLGITDVPCVEVRLEPSLERELNVRLNKNSGEWDWDALANQFDFAELMDWGFTERELAGSFPLPNLGGDQAARAVGSELGESHVRMFQLFFDVAGYEEFTLLVEQCCRERGHSNPSDAVLVCLREAAAGHEMPSCAEGAV